MSGRLLGARVLVTRPRGRATELCFLLEDEGAQVVAFPLLELLPPLDPRPLRAAAERLSRYRWVAFASPSAVQALCEAVREAGTQEALRQVKIAAVGPGTAQAARDHGLEVEVEAGTTTGEGLARAMEPSLLAGDEVLLPSAQEGRKELAQALLEAGVEVTRIAAYRSAPSEDSEGARALLEGPVPDAVVLASPRACEALVSLADGQGANLARASRLVAIGPTTAAALERLGLRPAAIAGRPTAEGLVDAVVQALSV